MDDSGKWAEIINTVSPDVDAIVSGHTHLAYNCSFPVAQWATDGRAVTDRPVVSAGQYGTNLNQLVYTVDGATGEVSAKTQALLPLEGPVVTTPNTVLYPPDKTVEAIVAAAVTAAESLGKVPLGQIAGEFGRAQALNAAGARIENRGGESTLGNLVAEVQQWATEAPESGAAQIAFMNPGGLRGDMLGVDPGDGSYPRVLTYREAAGVQSFANTLVNMQLTGAQIKTVLEQQWQRDAFNSVPTRPFLRLGASEGFEYTYTQAIVTEQPLDNPSTPADESLTPYQAPEGTVTGMWLNSEPIDLGSTYSVTVNSFLGTGGDNFREFASGAGKRDIAQGNAKVPVLRQIQPVEGEARQAGSGIRRGPHHVDIAAHHEPRKARRRFLTRIDTCDDLAHAQDGGRLAEPLHLFETMGNIEDGTAFLGQALEDQEELIGFLRREHRGRLVHDQQLRLLQQAADDLDALTLADRQIADGCRGFQRQSIFPGNGGDLPRQSGNVEAPGKANAIFSATVRASNREKC